MKKAFKFLKGIVKGVRDAAPVPSKEAENETENKTRFDGSEIWQLIGQRLSSRGIMIAAIVYLIDQLFKFGLFS